MSETKGANVTARAGGLASIAHRHLYPGYGAVVPPLPDGGVNGSEVMQPEVEAKSRDMYTNLARFRGKFTTGGSDDHGTVKTSQTLGTIRVPESMIKPILDRL